MNLGLLLELAADEAGERVALGGHAGGITFAELRRRVSRRAVSLLEAGSPQLVFLGQTGPEFVEALFAAAWAGIPFAPLNYRLGRAELAAILQRLGPGALLATAGLESKLRGAAAPGQELAPRVKPSGDGVEPAADPDAVAVLLHTSGTTAAPKAALLRHRHLFAYVVGAVELASAGPDESALVSVPPYHVAGVVGALTTTYTARRSVHLADFEPVEWLLIARREAVTHAFIVPTMLARLVEALEAGAEPAPETLRVLSYGGSPASPDLVERAVRLFPAQTGFVNAFGLTETSSTVALLSPDDHRAAVQSTDPPIRARLRSVGRPMAGVEVRIAEDGEVLVRGEQVGGEYRDQPARLNGEGWLRTGDVGHFDADGYLFLDGRTDDLIIRGGENISPLEVEEAIAAHPDVQEAAVAGISDEEWGQRVGAAIVLRPGAALDLEGLRGWLRGRLASYKIPDLVAVIDELPRTDLGKLRRRDLAPVLDAARKRAG